MDDDNVQNLLAIKKRLNAIKSHLNISTNYKKRGAPIFKMIKT